MVDVRPSDEPWGRLPWSVPVALVLTLLGTLAFLWLLMGHADRPPLPPPVEMQLVEPEPPASVEPETPPPPQPPPPEPAPAPETLPEPLPVPVPPPKPRPIARVKPAVPKPVAPPVEAPPAAAVASAPPAPVSPEAKPGGNSMGARAIYQPLPEIPEDLRRRTLNLVALARFHVAANGSAEVELVEPTPEPTLNRALLETLARWRFFPAIELGKPVASVIDIRVPITVR